MTLIRMFRFAVAGLSGVAVVVLGLSCGPRTVVPITLGDIADREKNYSGRTVRISNAGGGKLHGRYLVFQQTLSTRRHVVLAMSGPVEGTVFTGFCSGVRITSIPGCPCEPPFVLVEGGSSSITD